METSAYDAHFLCLRSERPRSQGLIVQAEQPERGIATSSLRAPRACLAPQLRTTLPPRLQRTPPRYKLAVITWLGIFPLITLVLALFGPLLMQLPLVARTFVLSTTLVPVMTYLIVPLYTWLFSRWLNQPAPDYSRESLRQEGVTRYGSRVRVSSFVSASKMPSTVIAYGVMDEHNRTG